VAVQRRGSLLAEDPGRAAAGSKRIAEAGITTVTQSAPAPGRGPRSGQEPRLRRRGARMRPARRRRGAVMVSGVVALAIAAGGCTAAGRPGGHAVRPARASPVAPPQHRRSGGHSVQLVVEASGDLLIHTAVYERALVDGAGRSYDFAPMFAQIRPYIAGADLALCHVETPMTPAAPAGYPTFNTPARAGHRDRSFHRSGLR
jgi:hypothetical protein